jgi:hypothetical protein
MKAIARLIMRPLRRAGRFIARARHAFDLWNRLGFAWSRAWNIAGTWQ